LKREVVDVDCKLYGFFVAFTPKGGCPLKTAWVTESDLLFRHLVAFTPKGGCPLKRLLADCARGAASQGSTHPQGWVPIETAEQRAGSRHWTDETVAFTPKGGCPLKRSDPPAGGYACSL